MTDDLAEYLLDNYGVCNQIKCRCLKTQWKGRACMHWKPLGVTTWDELKRVTMVSALDRPRSRSKSSLGTSEVDDPGNGPHTGNVD